MNTNEKLYHVSLMVNDDYNYDECEDLVVRAFSEQQVLEVIKENIKDTSKLIYHMNVTDKDIENLELTVIGTTDLGLAVSGILAGNGITIMIDEIDLSDKNPMISIGYAVY